MGRTGMYWQNIGRTNEDFCVRETVEDGRCWWLGGHCVMMVGVEYGVMDWIWETEVSGGGVGR